MLTTVTIPIATAIGKKVFAEDGSIYSGVQRGMECSPFPGVIGVREERVYHFQKYVLDNTATGARELPQVDAAQPALNGRR